MASYDTLLKKLEMDNTFENRKYLKAIVHALLKNGDGVVEKQAIDVDEDKMYYLYNSLVELGEFFDYKYNSKIDLTKFLYYLLNDKSLDFNAIFCPGYTKNGYKDYIGNNNTSRLIILNELSNRLNDMNINADFNIMLADIFLENTDTNSNTNWKNELSIHRKLFKDIASKYFQSNSIMCLSDIYQGKEYIEGFVDESICLGKVYDNFYKNNKEFYEEMGWTDEQIKYRNDRLFTIYTIISQYINSKQNGIYIPMETMYSRSKVMTSNDTCTMYLIKKKN